MLIFSSHAKFFWVASMLLLQGCIGSAIVFGDVEENNYGNLGSVPDRPARNNLKSYQKENKRLQHDHSSAESVNKKIRAAYIPKDRQKDQ
ncbi:MAG: hypothetical protein JNK42_04000 [Caedimonas sp.]|nr:hypothetical protein [Caedimonas sp.]